MDRETRVCVIPGGGIVARAGRVVAVIGDPTDPAVASILDWVRWMGRQTTGGPPEEFVDALLARIASPDHAALPAFGAVRLGDHPVVVVHGQIEGRIQHRAGGDEVLDGQHSTGVVHTAVSAPYGNIILGPEGVAPEPANDVLDLHAGVVPGGGVVVVHAPVADPVAVEGPPIVGHSRSVVPETGELVEGIACPDGHFNHPNALRCTTCSRSLLTSDRHTVMGPRRSLGTLTFEDGSRYVLHGDYVIGREPERDAAVVDGRATPLRIDDPEHLVSRIHADVRLVGWNVEVIDRASANGTLVMPPEGNQWQRLASGEPYTVSPGTRISIGRRICIYEWPA